jgi:hypothetical protein
VQSVSICSCSLHTPFRRNWPGPTAHRLGAPLTTLLCMCSQATLDTTVRQLKTIIDPQKPATDYKNANFPVDQEGRTLHLGCKASIMQLWALRNPCSLPQPA